MKYILTQTDGNILGPFTTVSQNAHGWVADDSIYYTSVFGALTSQEVSDDYENPTEIENYNIEQAKLRAKAYLIESDPIFFQYQRGSKTEQEWLDAVNSVKARFPYKDIA